MKRFWALLVLLLLFAPGRAPGAAARFFQPLDPPRRVQMMVHRGLMRQAPENTRPAIELAIADALEWIEVDVRLTSDRQHVLFHDAQLDAKSDGHGAVAERSLAEIRALDAGAWFAPRFAGTRILTLAECLALAKGKVNLYLDCKAIDPELLVREIRAAGMERQVVVFDKPDVLARIRELGEGQIALMPKWHANMSLDNLISQLDPAIVEVDADEVTPELCERFHAHGISVQAKVLGAWDQVPTWEKMYAAGVDYLQTDLPEEIIAFDIRRRVKTPPVEFALHRGAKRYAPENTLPAFEKAFKLGANFVEFDVRGSSDHVYFLLHDGGLDRTTNVKGPINKLDAKAISGLDAGGWFGRPFAGTPVPTLDAFLDFAKGHAQLYFDAKAISPDDLAAAITRHGLIEQTVVYQGPGYLVKLKQIEPRIRRMPPLYRPADLERIATGVEPYACDTAWEILSSELIARCHKLGIKVFSDGIGDHESVDDYRQAIGWGIDLIQTDHPLRVLRAIELTAAEEPASAAR